MYTLSNDVKIVTVASHKGPSFLRSSPACHTVFISVTAREQSSDRNTSLWL